MGRHEAEDEAARRHEAEGTVRITGIYPYAGWLLRDEDDARPFIGRDGKRQGHPPIWR